MNVAPWLTAMHLVLKEKLVARTYHPEDTDAILSELESFVAVPRATQLSTSTLSFGYEGFQLSEVVG
jgi:hypothetical protein